MFPHCFLNVVVSYVKFVFTDFLMQQPTHVLNVDSRRTLLAHNGTFCIELCASGISPGWCS